MKMHNS